MKKFILVYGEGFGVWCWYKIVVLLEECGLFFVIVDFVGFGFSMVDLNSVFILEEYLKLLIEFF